MIYGAIGVQYKSKLVIVDSSIDSAQYKENILKSEMITELDMSKGKGNWVFMQDGARCHTSSHTIKWLGTQCRYITKWPANSPDLNPIETLWGSMKKAVAAIRPETPNELKNIVQQVWDNYSQEAIDSLVMSFYQRLQLVIAQAGNTIQPFLRKDLSSQNIIIQYPENIEHIPDVIGGLEFGPNFEYNVPVYNQAEFSQEEDEMILKNYTKGVTNYSKLAKYLQNRSPVQVKNRMKILLKRKDIQINIHFRV